MAFFTGKNNFASGDTVTHTSLNNITDNLRLSTDSVTNTFGLNAGLLSIQDGAITTALLETSTDANTGISTIKIQDGAITTAKLPDSTGTTDGVTYAKIQYVSATAKLLGRTTAGSGVVEEVDIDTDLSVVSANDDTIPSAKATKAYVDSAPNFVPTAVDASTDYVKLPNGLIIKMGSQAVSAVQETITFDATLAFTTIYSVQLTAFRNGDNTVHNASLKSIAGDKATMVVNLDSTDIDSVYYTVIGR
jgi:hypothetical protein